MCGIGQAVHVQLSVEEGNGKPPPLIRTSQVYDGTSEMTIPPRACLMAENSSSSSVTQKSKPENFSCNSFQSRPIKIGRFLDNAPLIHLTSTLTCVYLNG